MGKGSKRRPTNEENFAQNYERIFGGKAYSTKPSKESNGQTPKAKDTSR